MNYVSFTSISRRAVTLSVLAFLVVSMVFMIAVVAFSAAPMFSSTLPAQIAELAHTNGYIWSG